MIYLNRRCAVLEKSLEEHGIPLPERQVDDPSSTSGLSIMSVSAAMSGTDQALAESRRTEKNKGWLRILENVIFRPQESATDFAVPKDTLIFPFLASETYEYLMDLFWTRYNAIIPIVERTIFEEHRRIASAHYYSTFLNTCMLAIGYRYADKTRPDVQCLRLSKYASILHSEATNMVDKALGAQEKLPLVLALLLLADLEWAAGRERQSWMMGRLSIRLVDAPTLETCSYFLSPMFQDRPRSRPT